MEQDEKRLFFGVEIDAPWPQNLPPGRLLDEGHRHLTLAFLGNTSSSKLFNLLPSIPKPSFRVGPVGHFDEVLFLPKRHPNVAAWRIMWHRADQLEIYQKELSEWLGTNGYSTDTRLWLPHVTLCRQPFDLKKWNRVFQKLPFCTGSLNLYESCGNLNYQPIWSYSVQRPFVEIEHTADMAFRVYGETLPQLYDNACTALAFKCPPLIYFLDAAVVPASLEDLVMALNTLICIADGAVGCPMKAVSFHGEITQTANGLHCWEMIVDV